MRWMALLVLTALLAAQPALAQNASPQAAPKSPKVPTSMARPTAEPAQPGAYENPIPSTPVGPTAADRGPAQKYFVLASEPDDLAETQVADNKFISAPQKMALDKQITVPLIHDIQNDASYHIESNHALQFEAEYLNWGATTKEQLQARQGHYFTITWVNKGPRTDFTARFEYRQVKSQEIVRTLVQAMPQVRGAVRSYFGVVDKAYQAYGPVCSWRFSILRGDTIVAQTRSFVW
ncbi:MAG: hypothetical protein LV481_12310 [Methylacidiphilales bacterium]|nr:hypothetical protein [Candidatus Methylacidiphilales bacterium]